MSQTDSVIMFVKAPLQRPGVRCYNTIKL